MGCCYSKTIPSSSSNQISQPQAAAPPISSAAPPVAAETSHSIVVKAGSAPPKIYKAAAVEEEPAVKNTSQEEDSLVKKEIFVIKHRKSHDRSDKRSSPPLPTTQNAQPHPPPEDESASSASATEGGICNNNNGNINTVVRTSSCTKEEVDAILIQCGRLSRSNSSGKTPLSSRKYSGSKRSYDFDNENDNDIYVVSTAERPRHRQSSRSSSQGRRRTPSRERDQQRSGSRERGSSSGAGGRRVSRSPGRRSENNSQGANSNAAANANSTTRPKMVSVPATVSALEMDKSNNNGVEAGNSIKRISVKRNVGVGEAAARTAASPRSQSPARTNSNAKGCNNDNQQQQPTLNRSNSRKAEHSPYRRNPLSEIDPNSRKAEHSPYRRNPLSEIDPNSLAYPHSAANKISNKGQGGIKESTNVISQKSSNPAKEQKMIEDVKMQGPKAEAENLKSQPLTRSRSSRRSRDLDLNPETLLNPIPSSYTSLLLEDIQNFHQTNNNASSFSLPACVSKACTILEAVADLNSTTSSKLSDVFSEDRKCQLPTNDNGIGIGRKMTEIISRDPFVESEVMGSDDLMEPSFHKYVTVRRGGSDMDEQESSGSNSFVGSSTGNNQVWGFSSSSREPNSADSTDRSTTKSREDQDYSGQLGHRRHCNSSRKGGRRRDSDHQHAGGKIAAAHSIPFAATT